MSWFIIILPIPTDISEYVPIVGEAPSVLSLFVEKYPYPLVVELT